MHVAVLVSSILPPSVSLLGLGQLLHAPSQACAAVPGSSPAWGRAWVPSPSESAPKPANEGGKKAASRGLWLRNSPAVGLLRNGRDSLARGIAAGGIRWTPQRWAGLVSPHQPAALTGECPCRGPLPGVVPTGDVWSSPGHGPGLSPSPERPLCAQGFL